MATTRRQQIKTQLEGKREQIEKARKKQYLLLFSTFNSLFNSAEGKFFLRWMMDRCGYQKASCVLNTQNTEISPLATIHDDARRSLYLELRKYIKPEVLFDVELAPPKQEKE